MQKLTAWRWIRNSAAAVLMPLMAAPAGAQSHVVPLSELTETAAKATQSRQQQEASVQRLMESEQARAGLEKVGIDANRVIAAISQLDDAELAKLSARAEQVQADFAAGRLTERDLLWILVAIAALILIIVAVR